MDSIVAKYGKQLMQEIMDSIIITGTVDALRIRRVLVDIGRIAKTSKMQINASYYKVDCYCTEDGVYGRHGYRHYISIKNGRSTTLYYIHFKDSDIPCILEDLK
jgi:hypothetical protein